MTEINTLDDILGEGAFAEYCEASIIRNGDIEDIPTIYQSRHIPDEQKMDGLKKETTGMLDEPNTWIRVDQYWNDHGHQISYYKTGMLYAGAGLCADGQTDIIKALAPTSHTTWIEWAIQYGIEWACALIPNDQVFLHEAFGYTEAIPHSDNLSLVKTPIYEGCKAQGYVLWVRNGFKEEDKPEWIP